MATARPNVRFSPEELFAEAVNQNDQPFSSSELKLLISGLAALRSANEKRLSKIEENVVNSLIAYVAHAQKVDETVVSSLLKATFQVSDVARLSSQAYNEAVAYLADLDVRTAVN